MDEQKATFILVTNEVGLGVLQLSIDKNTGMHYDYDQVQ
jgi:adenosyl cobinamide kinase/adenosyl cobinamide phosphate guanylyltransferase